MTPKAERPPAGLPPLSRRPRVLVLAAACNPCQPSDAAAGWGWVRQIARFADTWALCGAWDREGIERHLKARGEIRGLQFVFVDQSRLEGFLKRRRPLYEIHYLAHYLWHRRAFQAASGLFAEHPFDLVHQLTRNGFREPGFLWRLQAPFVWGPVGGTQNYPWRFLGTDGPRGALKEGARSLVNVLQLRFSPRVRQAAARAAALIAANSEIQADLARVHGGSPLVLCDTGVEELQVGARPHPPPPLNLLWSGKFGPHKALHLLLHALAGLPANLSFTLRILGAGPQERRWRDLARRLGVDRHCQWLGWLPLDEARQHYAWAHVLAFTSLRDTSGNVVLEALSHGVPVICLDHQGAGDMVTPQCGIKVPVTTPPRVIAGLGEAVAALAQDPAKIVTLSEGALARAQDFLWSRQGERLARVYEAVLSGRRAPNLGASETAVGSHG